MAVHEYKCAQCGSSLDVKVTLGEASTAPECINVDYERKSIRGDHTMRRVYQLSGFTIK